MEKLNEYNADLVHLSCVWLDYIRLKDDECLYPIVRQYEEPKFPETDLLILINVFSLKESYINIIPHKKVVIIQTKEKQKINPETPDIIKKRRIEFR